MSPHCFPQQYQRLGRSHSNQSSNPSPTRLASTVHTTPGPALTGILPLLPFTCAPVLSAATSAAAGVVAAPEPPATSAAADAVAEAEADTFPDPLDLEFAPEESTDEAEEGSSVLEALAGLEPDRVEELAELDEVFVAPEAGELFVATSARADEALARVDELGGEELVSIAELDADAPMVDAGELEVAEPVILSSATNAALPVAELEGT